MKKGSVAMIISYSGMTQEMITCAEIIRDKGLPIIHLQGWRIIIYVSLLRKF